MKAKEELNILNVWFCLLVVAIHLVARVLPAFTELSVRAAIVTGAQRLMQFVVQGFILVSAIKSVIKYKSRPFSYGSFLWNRTKKIFFPYLCWVLIYYLVLWRYGFFYFDGKALLRYAAIGNLSSQFYFIIVIAQFYLLMPLWLKMVKHVPPGLAVLASLAVTVTSGILLPGRISSFLYWDRVFTTYLFYWVLGCYIGAHYQATAVWLQKWRAPAVALSVVLAALNSIFFVRLRFVQYYKPLHLELLHMAYCIAAVLAAFCIALWLAEKIAQKKCRILQKLVAFANPVSYYVYLVHCLPIICLYARFPAYGVERYLHKLFISAAVTLVVSFGGAWGYLQLKRLAKNNIGSVHKV